MTLIKLWKTKWPATFRAASKHVHDSKNANGWAGPAITRRFRGFQFVACATRKPSKIAGFRWERPLHVVEIAQALAPSPPPAPCFVWGRRLLRDETDVPRLQRSGKLPS